MNILSKYICKVVISNVFLVVLILLGVESFLELATELKEVGKGNFHLLQAVLNVPLILPTDFYELFPMAALIGSLMGLGRLANQSELIVMAAAGMSKWHIIRTLLLAAFVLLLITSFIGEVIAPKTQQYARDLKTQSLSNGQTLKTAEGVWFRDGNNFIFIKEILVGNRLQNVTRYKLDNHKRLVIASHAEEGVYERDRWWFHKVTQTQIFGDKVVSQVFPLQAWDIHLDKRLLGVSNKNPNQMTLIKLYSYIQYRHQNVLGTGIYEFSFWKRVIHPISGLVMLFLAVPFIFGPLRSVSMGLRIVAGVIVGFSFYILNQFFGPMTQVYQIPAMLAAILPTVTFAILGTFLLFLRS